MYDNLLVTIETAPERPAVDPTTGLPVVNKCLSNDTSGSWILNRNCQRLAYARPPIVKSGLSTWLFVVETGEFRPIETGGDYICLAGRYYVDWGAAAPSIVSNEPATCPDGIAPLRQTEGYLTVDGMLSNARVLREESGRSWIVWGGERFEIRSGVDFSCWVAPDNTFVNEYDVWDFVTVDELANIPIGPDTTYISNCYPPEF